MRVVTYARYSSENQREASIEDQVRICTARIEAEGWALVATYTDYALCGASHCGPDIKSYWRMGAAAASTSSSPRRLIACRVTENTWPRCSGNCPRSGLS